MTWTTIRRVAALLGVAAAMGCPSDDPDGDGDTAAATDSGTTGTPLDDTTGGLPTGADDPDSGDGSETAADSGTGTDADSDSGSTGDDTGDSSSDSGTTGVEACTVVLAEVHADALGGDDMFQWIKLKNPCPDDIDLATWTLGWGGENYVGEGDVVRLKQLDAPAALPDDFTTVIPAGACYRIGGPMLTVGDPTFDFPDDFAPGLTFALPAGSGIALFDMPADEIDATTVPVDAVVYGANNDNDLIDHTGDPLAAPHVDNHPEGGSIVRTALAPQWEISKAPQPAVCPDL